MHAVANALAISDEATVEQLIARVASAQRLRTLHSTVLCAPGAQGGTQHHRGNCPPAIRSTRLPSLLVGRGRHHATLSVAIGERMGVIGALSTDTAERCLAESRGQRHHDRRRLPARAVEPSSQRLAQHSLSGPADRDARRVADIAELPNLPAPTIPQVLLQRMVPLIPCRAPGKRAEAPLNRSNTKACSTFDGPLV